MRFRSRRGEADGLEPAREGTVDWDVYQNVGSLRLHLKLARTVRCARIAPWPSYDLISVELDGE